MMGTSLRSAVALLLIGTACAGPIEDCNQHEDAGRRDWVANGVFFAAYHLHTPWVIPTTLLDTFILSYPSKRYRSALIGIAVHSAQSIVVLGLVLALVLKG